jgi:hypothetical protein
MNMRPDHVGAHVGAIAALVFLAPVLTTAATAEVKRGPAPAAPHAAAPAPHVSAPAPHISAPAPHVAAPAPHISAPAPHIAAPQHAPTPHFAAPRTAPHAPHARIASPHVAPSRAAPNATSLAHGRHAPGPQTPNALANHNRGSAAPNTAAAPNVRDRLQDRRLGRGNAPNTPNAPSTVGQGPATHNLAGGLRSPQQSAAQSRILRNSSLATLTPRDPAARALTRSTFRGRFAQSGWARDWDHDHHHHHHFGFVLGFAGGVFWPYAYDDFVDYTFWPSAYDTFWPYAYDDVYEGLYGAYAPQYGESYAYAGAPASSRTYADLGAPNARGGGAAQICTGEAQGLTDFPIERIAQQVGPDQQQQALLDDLKATTDKAVQAMQAACPGDLPATPTGRLAAMRIRVTAMLQAVQTVRPALDRFYGSLSDEQKERFNALDQGGDNATANARPPGGQDLAQLCNGHKSPVGNLPIPRIRDSLQLSDAQNADLQALDAASAKAADILAASCPTEPTLTPPGRVAAMEQRLKSMLQAIETVRPALTRFYGALSDEQKARFDRLGARPT